MSFIYIKVNFYAPFCLLLYNGTIVFCSINFYKMYLVFYVINVTFNNWSFLDNLFLTYVTVLIKADDFALVLNWLDAVQTHPSKLIRERNSKTVWPWKTAFTDYLLAASKLTLKQFDMIFKGDKKHMEFIRNLKDIWSEIIA